MYVHLFIATLVGKYIILLFKPTNHSSTYHPTRVLKEAFSVDKNKIFGISVVNYPLPH